MPTVWTTRGIVLSSQNLLCAEIRCLPKLTNDVDHPEAANSPYVFGFPLDLLHQYVRMELLLRLQEEQVAAEPFESWPVAPNDPIVVVGKLAFLPEHFVAEYTPGCIHQTTGD
jgi:hypothetical protein